MNLEALLGSLCQDTACHDLRSLLQKAKGEASWFGKKIIVVKGHAGSIDCAKFISDYLEPPLKSALFKKDLRNRVEALELIDRVKELVMQADVALKSTYVVNHVFSDARNLDEKLFFLDKEMREFTPESFKVLFPHSTCEEKCTKLDQNQNVQYLIVTRKDLLEVTSLV